MTNSATADKKIQEQARRIILKTTKEQKPATTLKIINPIHEKTTLSAMTIGEIIVQLKNEGISNSTETKLISHKIRTLLFSPSAIWYWIILALSTVTALAVFFIPDNAYPIIYFRSILSFVFVLFLPGYCFTKAIFPEGVPTKTSSKNLDILENVALGIGISMAIVPIVALILNFVAWGLDLVPLTLSLLGLTIFFATIALFRNYSKIAISFLK